MLFLSTPIDLSLPLKNPIWIFTVVLIIILVAPLILKQLRTPGIIGLIVAGMIVGPNGLYLIEKQGSIDLLGKVGILYLMFLAGLEMDMHEFAKNQKKSIIFGLITFSLPFTLGFLAGYFILGLSLFAALILGIMFSPHTLLAYPIVSRLGLVQTEVALVAIGGTIITDTLVLILLTIFVAGYEGNTDLYFWIKLPILLVISSWAILRGMPPIAKWFLKRLESESGAQYIFVLVMIFISAILAELAGIEAIVGAFFAGFALNNLIPHNSPLMNRLIFMGNTFFIPFFLISVGMVIKLNSFTTMEAILPALLMVIVSFLGKYGAAVLTQFLFGYNVLERYLLYGLSGAKAAATLAVIMVGYNAGILNEHILNGGVMVILTSCLLASISAEWAGKRLVANSHIPMIETNILSEKILVPVSNPATIESLIDFAMMLKTTTRRQSIYPLIIAPNEEALPEKINLYKQGFKNAQLVAAATENTLELLTHIDINIANGIAAITEDKEFTKIVMGWNGQFSPTDFIFGSMLKNVLEQTDRMVAVLKTNQPILHLKRIRVVVPPNAELELGFIEWIETLKMLSLRTTAELVMYVEEGMISYISEQIVNTQPPLAVHYRKLIYSQWLKTMQADLREDDLLVVISARVGTLSYEKTVTTLTSELAHSFGDKRFAIFFPHQKTSEVSPWEA